MSRSRSHSSSGSGSRGSRTPTPALSDDAEMDGDTAPLPPPTRAEYASYTDLLTGLEARDRGALARRLVEPELESYYNDDDERRIVSEDEDEDEGDTATVGPNVVDARQGHSQFPSMSPSLHHRASQAISMARLAMQWPLNPDELPPASTSIQDMITETALSIVRRQGLVLGPGIDDDDIEPEPPLPVGMVERALRMINLTLASTLAARPVSVASKQQDLGRLGWSGVLSAASMAGDREVVEAANTRLRAIFVAQEEPDLLAHRLAIVSEALNGPDRLRGTALIDELYSIDPTVKVKRQHQSKAEIAVRRAKRKAKEERRAAVIEKRNEARQGAARGVTLPAATTPQMAAETADREEAESGRPSKKKRKVDWPEIKKKSVSKTPRAVSRRYS